MLKKLINKAKGSKEARELVLPSSYRELTDEELLNIKSGVCIK